MTRTMGYAATRRVGAWVVAVAVLAPVGAAAQTPAPAGAPNQPVIVKFPAAGVGLVEAVRLTLDNQPSIALAGAGVERQEGVVQEQRGAFDWTFSSRLFYSYRQQELPEARKEIERNKRAQLRKNVEENRENARKAQVLLDSLALVPTGGGATPQAQIDAINGIDPQIAAELRIIDALIAGETNATTRDQLLGVRRDLVSRLSDSLRSGLTESIDNFRTSENTLRDLGEAPSDEFFYQGNLSLQLSKLFRNGIQFTPFLQTGLEGSNFLDKPRSSDFGGKGIEPIYTTKAGASLLFPLARNRGGVATAGAERAARIEVDASRFALRYQADLSTLETTRAYWDLRAAQLNVEIAERSLKNQQRMVELTRAQAAAGTIPGIETSRVQASEARSRARFEDASRALQEAQVRLADVMGISASDDPATLPRAADDFPAAPGAAELAAPSVAGLAGGASERRADLQAALVSEQAGRALAETARTFTRPKLDLTTKVWWTALDDLVNFEDDPVDPTRSRIRVEEGLAGAVDRWVGPSVEASLDFERPFGNNQAQGRLAQQRAEVRRREISSADLRRVVRLGVVRSARALGESIDRVLAAEEAVRFYDQTIQGDFERYRAGDITLLDMVITEEQQIDALLSLVAARRDVARLIAELRFESGQILTHEAGKAPAVDRAGLTTVPRIGGGR